MVRSEFPDDEAIKARFWAKVDKSGPLGCWLWTADSKPYGYGQFVISRRRYRAHRVSYYWANGPIPGDKVIDHICRVRNCVNPNHLRLLTNVENVVIGVSPPAQNARRTSCSSGHPYTDEDTYINPSNGYRTCRTCNRTAARRRHQKFRDQNPNWTIPRDGECTVDGCERKRGRRGMCNHHYKQQLAGKPFTPPRPQMPRTGVCTADNCEDRISRAGLCDWHYRRRVRTEQAA